MSANPNQWSPFAGFYANLIKFDSSVQVVFVFEFSVLLLLGTLMYTFYKREQSQTRTIAPLTKFDRTYSIRGSI